MIKSYKDLIVWQRSIELVVEIYRITKMFPKEEVYGSIEGLMNHFKLVIDGIKVAPGEVYSATEAANGELGFLIISDGSGRPYRLKVRPPCFCFLSAFDEMIKGHLLADVVIILGSLNIIAGELDR